MVGIMKLNEIREIVDFMKENGVYELEYSERNTSIRLKMARPAHQRPWERFRSAAPESEAPQFEGSPVEENAEDGLLDMELSEAAEKMRQGAAKAGSAVVDTMKAGASYLKSKRDEYLSGGTPGAYDVKLEEEPQAEMPQAEEEAPCCEPEKDIDLTGEVKLDTEAAREAVSKTAEVVVNTAKAAVELGVAGVRRGSTLLVDWLGLNGEDAPEEQGEIPVRESEEADPASEEEAVERAPEAEAPAEEESAQSAEDGEISGENEEIEE
jgi:hypothetical protein